MDGGDDVTAVAHLERAIELDPASFPVRYALGKSLLKSPGQSERERGVDLLEAIARERPGHGEVLDELRLLLPLARLTVLTSELTARFPKNDRVLHFAASIGQNSVPADAEILSEDDARRAYREAVAMLQANDVEAGTEAYFRTLSQSPPAVVDSIRIVVEGFFGKDPLERAIERRNGDLKRAILDLWMNDDPTPSTVGNEVLAEFYQRLQEARSRFGSPIGERGYDDRGVVWLRLGPPDERFEGPGPPSFHPNETWVYRRVSGKRLVLTFVNLNEAGYRFASIGEAVILLGGQMKGNPLDLLLPRTSMDPVYHQILSDLTQPPPTRMPNFIDTAIRQDARIVHASVATALSSVQVRLADPGEDLEIAVDAVSFEDGPLYTTWVLIGYPLEELEPTVDSTGSYQYTIDKAATLFHDDGRVAFTREARGTAHTSERVESSDLITVDGLELQPAPGEYRLGVRVSDANSDRIGVYRYPVNLPSVDRTTLRLSDVVLADRVEEGDPDSRFSRNGLRIVPSPTRSFRSSRPIWLYFEIYPSDANIASERAYEIEVRIRTSDRRVSLTRRIFGSLGRLLSSEGSNEIAIAYDREFAPAAPSFETLSLDVSELDSGIYELMITVTDAISGDSTVRTSEFALRE
jgi:GWxTD domain-containing protein